MKNHSELLGLDDLECDIPFKPYKISTAHKQSTFANVPESVKKLARDLAENDWRFYAVDQDRGRCYHADKVITIPVWAIDKRDTGFKIWYISHEISHAFAGWKAKHGPVFMDWLQKVCPPEFVHHELGYKPRNAASAGIRKPGEIDTWDI